MKSLIVPEISGASNTLLGGYEELPDKIRFKVAPSIVGGIAMTMRTLVFFEDNMHGVAQCAHMITGCETCNSNNAAPIQFSFLEQIDLAPDVLEAVYGEDSKHELAAYAGGLILSLPIDVENPNSIYERGRSVFVAKQHDSSNVISIEAARALSQSIIYNGEYSAVAGH